MVVWQGASVCLIFLQYPGLEIQSTRVLNPRIRCWPCEFEFGFWGTLAAQQEAERSKFVVAKAEQERRAAIIRAEGESEAAKLVSF